MSKTLELTNRISCLDLSPKYRKRPEKLVDVGVQVAFLVFSVWCKITSCLFCASLPYICLVQTYLLFILCKLTSFLLVANLPHVYLVQSPLQVEIVSITALNLARMELELDLHLQQVRPNPKYYLHKGLEDSICRL